MPEKTAIERIASFAALIAIIGVVIFFMVVLFFLLKYLYLTTFAK